MPPKKPRCAFVEDGRQCRRNGITFPGTPLCAVHQAVVEAEAARPVRPGEKLAGILGRAFRGQKISDEQLFAGIEDVVNIFTRPRAAAAEPAPSRSTVEEWFRRHQAQHPPPPPRPKPAPGPDPRVVLGFAPGQKLTAEQVKKRFRELARKHHPDRGGSLAKMQELNLAMDALMATL